MKPKISTGYLTPQSKKNKYPGKKRLSNTLEDEKETTGFNEHLFQALMNCPEKKKLLLQLLAANKQTIDQYTKDTQKKAVASSPLQKLKTKKKCESPTALLRRRALEEMNGSSSNSNRSNVSSRTNSRCSEVSSNNSSPVPFENVLKGVVAYVEIKSRHDEDRSQGAKEVLKSMGAEVRERFTSDVTHVVFKDGAYTTFQKAKLTKKHLVSILWVEFCRKTMQRQNEKQYPAMRSGFDDETMICSQMQKEYEDIIREEYRRSLVQGTPLPTIKSLIDRRRTLMTPSISNLNSSISSYKSARDNVSSECSPDREIANINRMAANDGAESLVMDDLDCVSNISGPLVNGNVVEKSNNTSRDILRSLENLECSDMELTHIPSPSLMRNRKCLVDKTSVATNIVCTTLPQNNAATTKMNEPSCNRKHVDLFDRRKTICNSMISSDNSRKSNSVTDLSLMSSDTSTSISNNGVFALPVNKSKVSRKSTRSKLSTESKSTLNSFEMNRTASAMSQLKVDCNYEIAKLSDSSKNTSMSTLQISVDSDTSSRRKHLSTEITSNDGSNVLQQSRTPSLGDNIQKSNQNQYETSDEVMSVLQISNNGSSAEKRSSSHMSSLQISGSEEIRKCNINTRNSSFSSKVDSDEELPIVGSIIESLKSPKFVTIRKRIDSKCESSDDSEIVSPRKDSRRVFPDVGSKKQFIDLNKELIVNIHKIDTKPNTRKTPNRGFKAKERRKTIASRASKNKKTSPSNDSGSDVKKTDMSQSRRNFRKLYNPDDSIHIEIDSDEEREEKRKEVRKRKSLGGLFINASDFSKNTKNQPKEISSGSDIGEITPPKRSRKKPAEQDNRILNYSADEQKELLDELLNKKVEASSKTPKSQVGNGSVDQVGAGSSSKTPSRRKSTRIIKPTYKGHIFMSNQSTSEQKPTVAVTPRNRRSTLEFMSLSQITSSTKKLKKNVDRLKLPSIVCTKLHKQDVQMFAQIVKKLGRFIVEDEVSDRTTHIVAGEPKRTINMLRAISRGCWVLKFEWVLQSLEEGKWLPEEDFEVTDFSPVVQKCRLERQAFGAKYTMDIFESCPPIYVALGTNPRCSDLKELITTCKGKVVTATRMARIIVGQYLQQDDTVCVNESWILDCITFYRIMPFKAKYLLSNKRKSLIV